MNYSGRIHRFVKCFGERPSGIELFCLFGPIPEQQRSCYLNLNLLVEDAG